jgi:domain of unknown function (DUF1704)
MNKLPELSVNTNESNNTSIEDLYGQLMDLSPKIVTIFTPSNRSEEEERFLSGEIRNPQFYYEKLNSADFDEALEKIRELGDKILNHPDLTSVGKKVYEGFIKKYYEQIELLRCAQDYHGASLEEDKQKIAEAYKCLNIETYGEPNEGTYRSLLGEKLNCVRNKNLTGKADGLRKELFGMVDFDPDVDIPERFRPSSDTLQWMHGVAESLYGGMLKHIPDEQAEFNPHELQKIFTDIIEEEFNGCGGAEGCSGVAEGWTVSVEKATSINVKSSEKKIVIPDNDMIRSRKKVENLVVHEIGVHMLRSITGGETNILPLKSGLSGYYDTEEGLGVVMEQALSGKFAERGVDHYITAGLAHFDNKDFREAFEIKWRLSLLSSVDDGSEVGDEQIAKAKKSAFTQTLRSFRGANDLPLFKDLSYYNGSVEVWRYLESIKGDDFLLSLLLAGKVNTSADHRRVILESKSV